MATTRNEHREILAIHIENIAKELGEMLTYWTHHDLPPDLLVDIEYPFDRSLEDIHAEVWAAVRKIRVAIDPDPSNEELRRFIVQNGHTVRGLSQETLEAMGEFAEHHAGGLMVLGRPAGEHFYVKMHDSWGDDGPIVVHIYHLENADIDNVVEFPEGQGEAAFAAFLAMSEPDETLSADPFVQEEGPTTEAPSRLGDEARTLDDEGLAKLVERVKGEILRDMGTARSHRGEVMPYNVSSYSQLHDYVDANYYGGAIEEGNTLSLGDITAMQDIVHEWLASGQAEAQRRAMDQRPTLTVGELIAKLTEIRDHDKPVVAWSEPGGWYLNVTGLHLSEEDVAVTIETRNDFDTRQF